MADAKKRSKPSEPQVGHQDLPKHRANAYKSYTKKLTSDIINDKGVMDVTDVVKVRTQRAKEVKFNKMIKKAKKGKK